MLAIVKGSMEKVKAEMKQIAKRKAEDIKGVKSQIKSWKDAEKKAAKEDKRKENAYPKEFDYKLNDLEVERERYSSKAVPVRVGDIVINFTVYENAMKKLIDIKVYPEEIQDRELVILYHVNTGRGRIHLYDISKLFSDLKNIPVAEIEQDA